MIGMQDRLQRFHIHVNQEIGLKGFPTSHSTIASCPSSLIGRTNLFPLWEGNLVGIPISKKTHAKGKTLRRACS